MNDCKICGSKTELAFNALLLKKYDVSYYKCNNCGFIQTESPFWLSEAYASAITSLDIGLVNRNLYIYPILVCLIRYYFNVKGEFIDYGGGYGLLTRMMRDKGFDYYRYDTYCENIFVKDFDKTEPRQNSDFELLTAFEVFEHLENPVQELQKMLKWSTNIFFSTELQPATVTSPDDWWYIIPETGQHISFYTAKSLQELGKKVGLNYYSNGVNLHLFTKKRLNATLLKYMMNYRISKILDIIPSKRKSLLMSDFNMMKANNLIV